MATGPPPPLLFVFTGRRLAQMCIRGELCFKWWFQFARGGSLRRVGALQSIMGVKKGLTSLPFEQLFLS